MLTMMSDPAILKRLGERQKQMRIRMEMTQSELAEQAGVSLLTVANFEKGKSITVANLVKIMRVLGQLENLEEIFPEPRISPLQLREMQAAYKKRQPERVRKSKKTRAL
ncbi:MAG: helix-turn-helix domain-containing protein [Bacteroidales bacterium]|nr:helix-turn-helix domain-containing protein [Bacteroidales bacterium]MDE7102687.1 helix-turn-helix domain-containing protein [Bacteroidales bacterium]